MNTERFSLDDLCGVSEASLHGQNQFFRRLTTDSRTITGGEDMCFVALKTGRHDGHNYIEEAYRKGVRAFIVSQVPSTTMPEAGFVVVENPLALLQIFAAKHREKSGLKIIGITGSNGKTIVKEWLHQLLAPELKIVRNPRSFNSQIGVPLSVLNIEEGDELGIFEAGISLPGEMVKLAAILHPNEGVFTHVGNAHLENFDSQSQLVSEKCKLFENCERVFYRADQFDIRAALKKNNFCGIHITWGFEGDADMLVERAASTSTEQVMKIHWRHNTFECTLPFTDQASVANAMTCVLIMLQKGYAWGVIAERVTHLRHIQMRMERIEGWNGTRLISDVYNNDLHALEHAVEELMREKGVEKRIVVLSDILQTGMEAGELYSRVGKLLKDHQVDIVIAVGEEIGGQLPKLGVQTKAFDTTDALLRSINEIDFSNAAVLFKGARQFAFERLVRALQRKAHATVLEVNLNNLVSNLNHYRAQISKETRLMAMVKAFGYGTGGAEIAEALEFNRIDYLGVAYTDEGVALRKAGIRTPIMVMNPDAGSFHQLVLHNLEPEIYSLTQLKAFQAVLGKETSKPYSIHLKVDTGMHRLGFEEHNWQLALDVIAGDRRLKVATVLSHLAAADNPEHDAFTRKQIADFNAMADVATKTLGYAPLRHIANTAGLQRFPEARMDMVRLGIGLYGIESGNENGKNLATVAQFKSTISQIRTVIKGDSVGYNRSFVADTDRQIATIPVGYADGLMRSLSNGKGWVNVGSKKAVYVGRVCMDMIMIDVTDIAVNEGDEVILFGDSPNLNELATLAGTIPYEMLAGISHRVKRIFVKE